MLVVTPAAGPVRTMRTWTSYTGILQPTAPPLERRCHRRCLLNPSREVKLQRTADLSDVITIRVCSVPLLHFFYLPSAGRSDPQISVTTQEGNPIPRRCSNPPSHSSSPQTQARHSAPSPNTETQGHAGRAPRSPHGQGSLLRGQSQTWLPGAGSASQINVTPTSSQTHIGPVR